MPRFSANLTYLFQELPLLDRIEAAANAGFRGVEIQFPYDTPVRDIMAALEDNRVELVLINAPPGDWEAGERGLGALPGREQAFRKSIEDAIYYATALSCPRVHIMSGVPDAHVGREVALSILADNLKYAATACSDAGIRALIEPLNPVDVPGYAISHTIQARAVMAVVNSPNLHLQYDLYHGGMNGDDLLEMVRSNLDVIDHMQVAGVPGRHEPDTGDINFTPVFEALDMMGYRGWIGCEYAPLKSTLEGLSWASVYGLGRPFMTVE
jgi:2-dehydrotetronate isomerase